MNKAVLGAPGRSRDSPHCPSVCLPQAGTLSPQLLENKNVLFYAPIPETLQSHMPLPHSDGEPEAQHGAGCAWDHRDVAIFMQSPEPGPGTPPGLPAGSSFLLTLVLILDRRHRAGAEGGKTGSRQLQRHCRQRWEVGGGLWGRNYLFCRVLVST